MKKKLICAMFVILLTAMAVGMGCCIDRNFKMILNSTLENECVYIMNRAVAYAVGKRGNFAEMLTVEKNDTGVISYLSVDSGMLNELSLDVMEILESEMSGLQNIRLEMPLGNLVSSRFLSGRGPMLVAQAYPQGGINIDYRSQLTEGGINQVLFHLDMVITVQMESIFGLHHYSRTMERAVSVCDVVIVGNVPETYANLPADTDFLNLVP